MHNIIIMLLRKMMIIVHSNMNHFSNLCKLKVMQLCVKMYQNITRCSATMLGIPFTCLSLHLGYSFHCSDSPIQST